MAGMISGADRRHVSAVLLPAVRLALLLAIGFLPARPASGRAIDPVTDVAGFEAITSSREARGDADGFLRQLVAAIERDPAGLGAKIALLRLDEVRRNAADSSFVLPALKAVASRKIGDLENRDRLLELLARLDLEAGDFEGARQAISLRGVIRDWLVCGPFGFTERAIHDRAFGPEKVQGAPRLFVEEPFEGRCGKVYFRKVTIGPLATHVRPFERIWPQCGAAYALAQLRAPRGTEASLAIACAGSFKAWWNGRLVADFDRGEAYLPWEADCRLVFGEGWNRLLVKVAGQGSSFSARIVASDGSGPVAGLEVSSAGRIEDLGEGGEIRAPKAPAEPASALERAARAFVLSERGLVPHSLPELRAAREAEPGSAHLCALEARVVETAAHLPESRRRNEARRLLDAALERDPKFVPALARKARFLVEDGKPAEAVRALRALAGEHPGFAEAHRSAAFIAREQGWDAEALDEIEAFRKLCPRSPETDLFLASFYAEKGNAARALEHFRAALALDRSATWVEERIARLVLERGDLDEAEKLRRALAERYPCEPGRLDGLAEILRARGDLEGSAALFERAAAMRGGEPGRYVRAADCLLERGDRKGALRLYDLALASAPGDLQVRRVSARLRGEEDDFSKPFEVDLLPDLARSPSLEKYPKASTICLLDQTVSRIFRDGSEVQVVHQAFKILDQHGVERYHSIHLPGEILELRTIAKDGTIYEPVLTEQASEILMPHLGPGAVIEYRYRHARASPRFQYDSGTFYFSDPDFSEPFVTSRYVVIADKGIDLVQVRRNDPGEPHVEDRGETVLMRWEVTDSDRIDTEPFMPEKDEIVPNVALVERRSWDDVRELLRERFCGRTRLTPELRSKAAEVAGALRGDAAKARALYDFVMDHVRSEAGPGEASEIFSERAGSRTILLKALLDSERVPSRFAACSFNPRLGPEQIWNPPRPELFGASALVVEPRDGSPVWVVEGGRFLPYGLVPQYLQGATALLLSARGGEFRIVPEAPAENGALETRLEIRLAGRGAIVRGWTTVKDAGAYSFKERVATVPRAQLQSLVESQINQVFLGARLKSFDFPDADRPGVPFSLTFEAEVPRHVQLRDGVPTLATGLEPLELTKTFGGEPRREHPMVVRLERVRRDLVEIDVGPGYEVESVPPNLLLKEKLGAYSLMFELEGGTIRIVRSFVLTPSRIEREEYPALLRSLNEVDVAEAKRIKLRAKKPD